ncbi:ExbD/TolR family protein [Parafilimonas terrae]|jgi:biopolymer transport protein ExbD|uniref:Outer membrane transport energization protein ExbD n=1 Tax=Parafilimonas terrae TaxID=1465490 RepID=A0A1I5S3N2_9BACT|nr:biopolymer transporter ExbD [Parafilimonas terrae]SFP65368.1 outer membrane transport energization protein ExbD [Parafilimonas terrae]
MNIRRRFKTQAEVHSGTLNDILFILLFFFLIISTLANPNVVRVNNPKGTKDTKAKQNIVVSIDKDQHIYIGHRQIEPGSLDSLIKFEVDKNRSTVDTPSVVINADTSSYYGEVFRVMQSAKRAGAKVVANVK